MPCSSVSWAKPHETWGRKQQVYFSWSRQSESRLAGTMLCVASQRKGKAQTHWRRPYQRLAVHWVNSPEAGSLTISGLKSRFPPDSTTTDCGPGQVTAPLGVCLPNYLKDLGLAPVPQSAFGSVLRVCAAAKSTRVRFLYHRWYMRCFGVVLG